MSLTAKEAPKICVIIGKPRGSDLPSEEIIGKAFRSNGDGFGLAFHHQGENLVHIRKGAMLLPGIKQLIASVPNPREANMLLHFRNATQGRICPANCHPFPITKQRKYLRATRVVAPVAVAHNGIIIASMLGRKTGTLAEQDLSDTQLFIRQYLAGLGQALFNRQVLRLIEEAAGGKIAILSPRGIDYLGGFTTHTDGLKYSNLAFNTTYTPVIPTRIYKKCDLCGEWGEVRYLLATMQFCRYCYTALGFLTEHFADTTYGGYNYED